MPLSSNIHSYADVQAVLEAALPAGRAEYRLDTEGKATHWIQRANKYRLLLQKQLAATTAIKGYQPPTAFDRMRLRRVGTTVQIEFNPEPVGVLSLPTGEVIHPSVAETAKPAEGTPEFRPRVAEELTELELAARAIIEEQEE